MNEPEPPNARTPDSRRAALIGLILVILLVVGGLLLAHVLRRESQLQDCVMSGRTNCEPIDTGTSG